MMGRALKRMTLRLLERVRQTTRTAVVGHVGEYDPAQQVASVTPAIGEQDIHDDEVRELPPGTLQAIPIVHHGGSKRGFTFGLESGDPVILVVRHRSHQEIDAGAAAPAEPGDSRRMALSEAVGIPGYTPGNPGQNSDHYRTDGAPVLYMDASDILRIGSSTADKALALAESVDARLSSIQSAFDDHTHTAPSGATSTPLPIDLIGPLASVACDDVLVRS